MQNINDIISFQQQGKLLEAIQACELLIKQKKDDPNALHLMGVLYAQHGLNEKALQFLEQAVKLAPNEAQYYCHLANIYAKLNEIERATNYYKKALAISPQHIDTLNNLGNIYYKTENLDKAQGYYNQVLKIDPKNLAANFNLANIYSIEEKYKAAEPLYEEVLKQNKNHTIAMHNLGLIQRYLGKIKASLRTYWRYTELKPDDPDGYYYLALSYTELGSLEEAKGLYEKLLALKPSHPEANYNIATIFHKMRQMDKAKHYYEKALEKDPSNSAAKYMVAALNQETIFEQAPAEYIKFLFDQYAPNYEQHLMHDLSYKVPKLVEDLLINSIKPKEKSLAILDLGAGTGIMGQVLKPHAKKLTGVDLSSKMLFMAENKNIYTELFTQNCNEFLKYSPDNFDLILALELFIYFGKLDEMFCLIKNSLAPKGHFILTGELQTFSSDYILQTTGRFAHNRIYIEQLAENNNFKVKRFVELATRLHEGKPNNGFFAWLYH